MNCTGTDLGSCRPEHVLDRHMNVQVCAFAGLCNLPVWPDLCECTTGQHNVHVQGLSQVCKGNMRVLPHQNVLDM